MRNLFIFSFAICMMAGCTDKDHKMKTAALPDLLIKTAKKVYERRLTFGTGGDISVRIQGTDSLLIKPTGYSLGDLPRDKLVVMHINGKARPGSALPSQEAQIHCAIYRSREDVGAIMHMHAPYAAAWSTAGKKIPLVTQQSVSLLKDAAMVPYYKVGSRELDEAVVTAYKNRETYVVYMQNHGTFVVGKDLDDLFYKGDVVENAARIAFLSEMIGSPAIPSYVTD